MRGPKQILGPIGSSVLAFIGYKHQDKKSIYRCSSLIYIEGGWRDPQAQYLPVSQVSLLYREVKGILLCALDVL